jgi:hypothetical protein
MYLTARRGGFLWFAATPLGMLGGEPDGPTSAPNPGEVMSNATAHLRSQLRIVVIGSVLSMSALAADDEVRIGRYQTISTATRCERLEAGDALEPAGNPDEVVPRADAQLEPDVAANIDSVSKRSALSIVGQDANAEEENKDEE